MASSSNTRSKHSRPSSSNTRRDTDVVKLMMKDYKVRFVNDSMTDFMVEFPGPKNSDYEDGVWQVHVILPETYPYKPPLVRFVNRILHPNIEDVSGLICLNVLHVQWSSMFDITNIFEAFLPELLFQPNVADPFNQEAASLLIREPEKYKQRVKEYCKMYAQPEHIVLPNDETGIESDKSGEETDTDSNQEMDEDSDEENHESMTSDEEIQECVTSDEEIQECRRSDNDMPPA